MENQSTLELLLKQQLYREIPRPRRESFNEAATARSRNYDQPSKTLNPKYALQ